MKMRKRRRRSRHRLNACFEAEKFTSREERERKREEASYRGGDEERGKVGWSS